MHSKKIAAIAGLIFVALLAGDRLLYFVGLATISTSSERFVRLYNHRYGQSILVVGNSRADGHFPARILTEKLGVPVVNLGLGGEATVVSELLVRDYLEFAGRPALIVVEVSNAIEDPTEIGDFGSLANYSHRFSELRRERSARFHAWASVFKLLNLNSSMLYRALYGVFRPEGDRLFERAMTDDVLAVFKRRTPERPESRPENVAALVRLNEFAKSNDIPIRFVLSPYLVLSPIRTEYLSAWVTELESQIGSGVKIADYADLVSDRSCFMDSLHLNAKGVDLYMTRLISDGVLDVRR